jgi:hypothetical protein
MIRFNWLSVIVALFLTVTITVPGTAQTSSIPNDVTNPASDAGIPALLTGVNSIIRPQDMAVLQFDSFLDPSNGGDPTKLTAAALSIQLNHRVAQQQVELAIRYLMANRNDIVAGKNPFFNSIYGKPGRKQKVAILAPVSLPGTFNLRSPTLLQSQAQGGGGGGGGGGGNQRPRVSVGTLLNPGDSVFLVDPMANPTQNANNNDFSPVTYPDLTTQGYVVKISSVIRGGINQQGGQGGQNNQNNQNTDFILDAQNSNVPLNTTLSNATAWRVVRFDVQDDPSVYNQVLATYQAIRDALAGFDPTAGRAQNGNNITYRRMFRDINTEYAPGDAQFGPMDTRAPLNNLVSDFITANDPSGVVSTRGADRLVRQAGFSLSDSYAHLDTLYDQTNSVGAANARLTPLLWTEDNNLPIQFDSRVRISNATPEDRDFFHDRQTIFGGQNDPFNQYLGRAFLEEKILFGGGGFFDTNVATSSPLDKGVRDQRSPAGGQRVTQGGGNTPVTFVSETAEIPGTGKPIEEKTLRKWQMILASFAEYNTDLDHRVQGTLNGPRNIAVIGLQEMVGGGASSEIRASDATNYGLFADLIRTSGGSGIDFSRVEPIGKRGNAGFNPVVPVQ